MHSYTLSETLNELRKDGYVDDFNLQQTCLECRGGELKIFPEDFKVDKFYRFEGASNPSDQAIVYAISSDRDQLRGVLVNAYGMYSDPIADELLRKLEMRK